MSLHAVAYLPDPTLSVRRPFTYAFDSAADSGGDTFSMRMSTTAVPAYDSGKWHCLTDGLVAQEHGQTWGSGAIPLTAGFNNKDPVTTMTMLEGVVGGSEIWIYGVGGSNGAGVRYPSQITLEWSDDNSNWTTVEDRTGLTQTDDGAYKPWLARFTILSAGKHPYWRFKCYRGSGSWIDLSEVLFLA